jgi:hypothetical protein
MNHSAAVMGFVVFGAVGIIVGWYACKAWLAHADIAGTEHKISGLKQGRSHNGQVAFIAFALGVLVLYGLVGHHK